MNMKEAIQWVNIAFMAVCRVINGAATSLGRALYWYLCRTWPCSWHTFTESEIQEFADDFCYETSRTVKFARTKAYDQLYSGDPTFITTFMAGMGNDDVTALIRWTTALNTLDNIGNSRAKLDSSLTDKLPYLPLLYAHEPINTFIQYEGVTTMC